MEGASGGNARYSGLECNPQGLAGRGAAAEGAAGEAEGAECGVPGEWSGCGRVRWRESGTFLQDDRDI